MKSKEDSKIPDRLENDYPLDQQDAKTSPLKNQKNDARSIGKNGVVDHKGAETTTGVDKPGSNGKLTTKK